MAAYGAVVSLSQTLDAILHSNGRPVALNGHQLESLHEKVSFLQQFLENPIRKTSNQETAENLEIKIRDVAFKAEDLIEAHILNLPVEQNENPLRLRPRPSLFFAVKSAAAFVLVQSLCHFAVKKFMPVGFQNLMSWVVLLLIAVGIILNSNPFSVKYVIQVLAKVKQDNPYPENQGLSRVIEEVGSIVNEVNKIKAAYSAEDLRPTKNLLHVGSSARGDSEVTGKNVVVGLDGDLEEMRARLTGDLDNLEVVPIVGMGGIGKTTLARQVYDDNYIGRYFDVHAWVTVSQAWFAGTVAGAGTETPVPVPLQCRGTVAAVSRIFTLKF